MKLSVFFKITDALADIDNSQATITLKNGNTINFIPASSDIYAIEEEYSKELEQIPTPSVIVIETPEHTAYIDVEEIAMVTI